MSSPPVDFGRTAEDYGRHREGFPPAFFERLAERGVLNGAGQHALDLATGTGAVARGLALRGCRVVGLDRSPQMLAQAQELDRRAGVSVEHRAAPAESTGLPDGAFELVTAGQCWHWFDRHRAAAEVRRVLAPGGWLVIAHFDWLPLPGNVVEATERLILAHNPTWHLAGSTGLYPAWLADVTGAGFEDVETFSFDVAVPYDHERWRGRIRASAGVGASLPADGVTVFDRELAELLAERFADEPLSVPHRVWAIVARRP